MCENIRLRCISISITFLLSVLRLVVIWSYTQNKATRPRGILCGWFGLEQSTTGHSFDTYIINVIKHAQDTPFLTFLLH